MKVDDLVSGSNFDPLMINNIEQPPTREEFYTNYPFFKYWKKEFNNQLGTDPGINIYLHIPFCIQICDYCFYMKELIKSKDTVDDYIAALCKEIELVSDLYNLRKRKVNAIYIGGGTPSVLTEKQFFKIIETLKKFHSIENPEFTFEAEPGTFVQNKLKWYAEAGVNRISMGVQSFDDEIIKLSSRKHTTKQAVDSINMVKDAGGFTVNIDLLSGLAGENTDSWDKTVDTALSQKVDMLTIYKMKVYSNTNFFSKSVLKDEIEMPSAEQEINFMKTALKKIKQAGYFHWSTFAFTIDQKPHQYIENTWRGHDLIAYGASSFGQIGNVNYQNVNNMTTYLEKVKANQQPVYRSYKLSMKDRIVKELLLCTSRLSSYSKSEFIEKYGFDYFDLIPEVLVQLIEKGYIHKNYSDLILTDKGTLFADFIGKTIASSVKDALAADAIGFSY
jgi:oxygen-independent coproporphyrinogen-3 oxidase